MKDYSKGRIYTIRCLTDKTLIYVGSTIQALCERFSGHKVSGRNKISKDRLLYSAVNGDWSNWEIELYELYPCSCKEELCRREGEIIRLIGTLNDKIAGRTEKEWREDNKEHISTYNKNWNENNKEYSRNYYEKNKGHISNRQHKWYEENREEYLEKAKSKVKCECGCIVSHIHLVRHKKSKKHIDLMII